MILRYRTAKYEVDFDLYGAQEESTLGIYDAIRSTLLDVTANAVLLRRSTKECLNSYKAERNLNEFNDLSCELERDASFADEPTTILIVENAEKDELETALFSFPTGLRAIAKRFTSELVVFGRSLNSEFSLSPKGKALLHERDKIADHSIFS